MNVENIKSSIRTIPDFPVKGILFRDVTTLFKNPKALSELSDILYEQYKDKSITKVVGLESRGFVLGSILAYRLGAGFVLCRKPGKLPAEVLKESYSKEYGEDSIEIHTDAIGTDDVVLIHDDILATGGSINACCNLVKKFKPKKIFVNCIIELEELHGAENIAADVEYSATLKVSDRV